MDDAARIRDTISIRLFNMGLKQKDMADAIGVPASTLNSWLKRGRDIPAQYIMKIAEFLDCSPIFILTGDVTCEIGPDKILPEQKEEADVIRGLSDAALRMAAVWDSLDEAGKAITLGDIYKRAEAASKPQQNKSDGYREAR